MKRIAIIGCGGSGKTALAKQLGAALGLPAHHLDRLFWRAGWQETPKEEWAALQRDPCCQPNWIMDGKNAVILRSRRKARRFLAMLPR